MKDGKERKKLRVSLQRGQHVNEKFGSEIIIVSYDSKAKHYFSDLATFSHRP